MTDRPALPRPAMSTKVCEEIGQGRILQCVRPGGWPEHLKDNIPEFEQRCTACDDIKARLGVLDRVKADWERRWGTRGRPTGAGRQTP